MILTYWSKFSEKLINGIKISVAQAILEISIKMYKNQNVQNIIILINNSRTA